MHLYEFYSLVRIILIEVACKSRVHHCWILVQILTPYCWLPGLDSVSGGFNCRTVVSVGGVIVTTWNIAVSICKTSDALLWWLRTSGRLNHVQYTAPSSCERNAVSVFLLRVFEWGGFASPCIPYDPSKRAFVTVPTFPTVSRCWDSEKE